MERPERCARGEPGDGADDSAEGGRKAVESSRVQVDGGYQNLFVFAERAARDTALWDGAASWQWRKPRLRVWHAKSG